MEEETLQLKDIISNRFHQITTPTEYHDKLTVSIVGNHSKGTFVKCVVDPIQFFNKWITWKKVDVETGNVAQCVHSTTFLFLAPADKKFTVIAEVHSKQFPGLLDKPLERFFIKVVPRDHELEESSTLVPSKPYVWRNDSDSFLKKFTITPRGTILPHLVAPINEKGKQEMF